MKVSAPAKMMICGEYAVLRGAPAMVAAVDRRAVGVFSDTEVPMSDETVAALDRAGVCGIDTPSLAIVRIISSRPAKIQLGFIVRGRCRRCRRCLYHDAEMRSTHRTFAMKSSTLLGTGIARLHRTAAAPTWPPRCMADFCNFRLVDDVPEIVMLTRPPSIHLSVVWTKKSARTSDFLRALAELGKTDAKSAAEVIASISDASERHHRRQYDQVDAFTNAFAEHALYMNELGVICKTDIVEESLDAIAEIAFQHGGLRNLRERVAATLH
ncbi:MAG: hypothetical protein R3A47_07755 [Polyangiales bacterium]